MKVLLKKGIKCVLILLTIVCIGFALLFSLVKAETPIVAQETPRLQDYLSQKLNQSVKVASVALKWHAFMPVLDFSDLEIDSREDAQKIFSVHEVSVGVRALPSLWHKTVLLKYLYVDGLSATLLRDNTGKWVIKGLEGLMNTSAENTSNTRRSFKIEGKNLLVMIQKIFPRPLFIENLNARLIIENTPPGIQVMLKRIHAKNDDMTAMGDVSMRGDAIDLKVNYQLYSSMAQRVNDYLPRNLLEPELIHWLTQSIKQLKSGNGVFILKGNVKDFPFASHPGEFLADAQLKGLNLKYDPLWPLAENIDGELIFQGNLMHMDIHSAKMAGVPLENMVADIPSLGKESVLEIRGNIQADSQALLDFIKQSPLQKTLGKYFAGMSIAGDAKLHLGFTIPLAPLAKPPTPRVAGSLFLQKNKMRLTSATSLEDLNAEIQFNETGITGKILKGRLWGSPISIAILPKRFTVNYQQGSLVCNNRGNNLWDIKVAYPQINGVLTVQNGYPPKRITGRFSTLTITGDQSSYKQMLKPRQIPPLDLSVDDFRYHDKQFGKVNFRSSQIRNGLKLEYIQAVLGKTQIRLEGQWLENGKGQYASVSGTFNSQNMAETLKNWGLSPAIQSQSGQAHYSFVWPGSIYNPDVKNLQGNIYFEINKGQILNVSSQAKMDIGRLLTLLSFQSLSKKLRLDFSDITTTGLPFDVLTGDFLFKQGIASTTNTVLTGPISYINMTGSIDFINHTYQLKVAVTPQLTSSLPIIATIAGGPIAGAATWAADKLINPLVNKITTDTYTVTGPWDKPVIK